jgi:hypothetical protein
MILCGFIPRKGDASNNDQAMSGGNILTDPMKRHGKEENNNKDDHALNPVVG